MKRKLLLPVLIYLSGILTVQAQGNYVPSGSEATNFATIDLATPGSQTWATARTSTPGYFSAVGSSSYSSASDAANINGYVKNYVTSANQGYSFPVGSGSDYRNLTTSGTIANNSIFATAWIEGDPNSNLDPTAPNAGAHSTTALTSPIFSVSAVGEWDWQDLSSTGNGVTITVSIPDMSAFATTSNLRLVGWNGTSWIDLSGSATASGNTENSTLSGTMQSGITAIGIGSISYALPLSLVNFTATEQNCTAQLKWETANEINTDHFTVEQSLDGIHFTAIGQVTAQGNSIGHTYNYITAQSSDITWYRLKMVDVDGSYTYSKVIILHSQCINQSFANLYPIPATSGDIVTLTYNGDYTGQAKMILTNIRGQQLLNKTIRVNTGTNTEQINTSGLSAGTYYIQLLNAGGNKITETQKLVVQ